MARPMPLLPPVTMATLPSRPMDGSCPCRVLLGWWKLGGWIYGPIGRSAGRRPGRQVTIRCRDQCRSSRSGVGAETLGRCRHRNTHGTGSNRETTGLTETFRSHQDRALDHRLAQKQSNQSVRQVVSHLVESGITVRSDRAFDGQFVAIIGVKTTQAFDQQELTGIQIGPRQFELPPNKLEPDSPG